jgi:RNA polymerase sigma factor (sigma-70 family)
MSSRKGTVFIVDDDPSVRKALSRLVRSVSLDAKSFESAEEFLKRKGEDTPSCIILDVRMPGVGGLDLQEKLVAGGLKTPIIFITGHGTVPVSVRAMKSGAADFLEKPFDDQTLLDAIHNALERDRSRRATESQIHEIEKRMDSLTPREREVFSLVVSGLANKNVARKLGASEKTIKVHRARVMGKMQAESLADLVQMAYKVDAIADAQPPGL